MSFVGINILWITETERDKYQQNNLQVHTPIDQKVCSVKLNIEILFRFY